ncbi:cytochrome P450 1A1-like [Oppia nitens]|uniref:cytochrome P450 1A1-like n=1 Tax=Oppia nitens TaxID=1686743 RepID=UPI0023DBDA8A|nr:cytochrome P450 1A1-like [Oppia nitens]
MGPTPYVFITDIDLAKEAYNRNELSGRPKTAFSNLVSNDNYTDVLFADFSPKWLALRRVAHLAVRKYSIVDRLPQLIANIVDQTVSLMLNREDINTGFQTFDYIYLLFLNIMAASVFGKIYDIEDQEFRKLNYIFHDFFKENAQRLTFHEFMPVLQYVDREVVRRRKQYIADTRELVQSKYISHYNDFNETDIRDLCDALILAKREAIRDSKESAVYLNDDNITMVIWDLFIGGVDTTHNTFKWLLLLLAKHPDCQQRLRNEIEVNIGDRLPVQEDRHRCHYTMAFIAETMRYRLVVPLAMYHKAVVDTRIVNHNIPKGTGIFVHHYHILNDVKQWESPDQFKPERFLDSDGKYVTIRPPAYIAFGLGRRSCLGEKLAQVSLFLVLVRLLQNTSAYNIDVESEANLEANYQIIDSLQPYDYKLTK